MTKYHISHDGPAVCRASVRECPIGGDHFENYSRATIAYEKLLDETYGGPFVPLPKPKSLPRLDANNVGKLVSDIDAINYISNGRDERIPGGVTPYLINEYGVSLKAQDDYYVHAAVHDEDGLPIVATSFDILADREAELARISFIGRFVSGERYRTKSDEADTEALTLAEPYYEAFKKHGGATEDDVIYVDRLYDYARKTGSIPDGFYHVAERQEENARARGKKYTGPTKEQRDRAYAVVNELL